MIPDLWMKMQSGRALNLAHAYKIEPHDEGGVKVCWVDGNASIINDAKVEDFLDYIKEQNKKANDTVIRGIVDRLRADAAPFSLEEIEQAKEQVGI